MRSKTKLNDPGASDLVSGNPDAQSQFPNTLWPLVCQAQDGTVGSAREALSKLCEMYWYPLYAFVRRSGCSPEDAEDVTQGFFAELLEKDYLGSVSEEKGRLRTFLMVCVRHYLHKWRTKARALKRGGGKQHVSIDQAAAEQRYRLEPADSVTPEILYDRHWALTVMKHAHERLRGEYEADGKGELFAALGGALSPGQTTRPHAEVALRLGMSDANVRQIASRMRKRYKDLLKEEIANTVHNEEEVSEEMAHLLTVFSQ